MIDERPPCYVEGDAVIYRGSQLGLCDRALLASRMGCPPMPPSERQAEYQGRGVIGEALVLERLERAGWIITDRQAECTVPIALPGVALRVHADALGVAPDGSEWVVEAKTLAPSTFSVWGRKGIRAHPQWEWQVGALAHAFERPVLMAVNEWGTHRHLDIRNQRSRSPAALAARVNQLEELYALGSLGECPQVYPCPFFYAHEDCRLTPEGTPEHIREVLRSARGHATEWLATLVTARLAEIGED